MTVIVGAGLAGACAAAWLAAEGPVTLLEAARPAAGASGAAAGLTNPFMGPRANPVWRHAEALDALHATLARASRPDLFRGGGLLRPARDARQAEAFRVQAGRFPDELSWLEREDVAERYPGVLAPWGGVLVRRGGVMSLEAGVEALLKRAGITVREGVRVVSVGESRAGAWVETAAGERIDGVRVLLAPGAGFARLAALAGLPLHGVKGQTVRVAPPRGAAGLPPLSGHGYVAPDGGALVLGATYEHVFAHGAPTEAATAALLAQAARMVPALARAEVLEARAGVRAAVPRSASPQRLPLVGPLPRMARVWALVGLGSKGLLTAPLLARHLPAWFRNPDAIPPEVRLR